MTDSFRTQHAEILRIASSILAELQRDPLAKGAEGIRSLLSKLAGNLKVHVAMEDKVLYPKMVAARDPGVSAQAKRFMNDMGGIEQAFRAYSAKWASAGAIREKASDFVAETEKIFGALKTRIDRENAELYPLADRL